MTLAPAAPGRLPAASHPAVNRPYSPSKRPAPGVTPAPIPRGLRRPVRWSAAATALPEPPPTKAVLLHTSSTTPVKPMSRPNICTAVSRSFSQTCATIAPNNGAVALRMAAKPAVIVSEAKANSVKGSAEFARPTTAIGAALRFSSPILPRMASRGSRTSAAIPTRSSISANGPKCGTAARTNRNEPPHSAASSTRSSRSRGRITPRRDCRPGSWRPIGVSRRTPSPARAVCACAPVRRHSR